MAVVINRPVVSYMLTRSPFDKPNTLKLLEFMRNITSLFTLSLADDILLG